MQHGSWAHWGLTDWMSFGAVIGCPKMHRLSYTTYFHNLDSFCTSVCVCFHLFVYFLDSVCALELSKHAPACVCAPVWVHICCMCVHAPEFRGSDSFDSYTCQWPDPGDNPCCHHKAIRKAPISPPDIGSVCGSKGGLRCAKTPPAILHNALYSFHPTNTWMRIQLILFHPSPFSQPAWHRERILCSSALPCVLHIGEKTYRKGR